MSIQDAVYAVSFPSHDTNHDVWRDDTIHVDGLHREVFAELRFQFGRLARGRRALNLVIEGRAGIGKSHFIGQLRRQIVESGHFFVLMEISAADRFWECIALAYCDAFARQGAGGESQLSGLLRPLIEKLRLDPTQARSLVGGDPEPNALGALYLGLQRTFRSDSEGEAATMAGLAMTLLNSRDQTHNDAGKDLMLNRDSDEVTSDAAVNDGPPRLPPRRMIAGIDRLARFAGKSVLVAIDQIDSVIKLAHKHGDVGDEDRVIHELAAGLLEFANDNENTLIAISALPETWELLSGRSVASLEARFPERRRLRAIPSLDVGKALVVAYLGSAYAEVGFEPPYPSWPVANEAFADVQEYTPRQVIRAINNHFSAIRDGDKEVESTDDVPLLEDFAGTRPRARPRPFPPPPRLDARFSELMAVAEVAACQSSKTVDTQLPDILLAGLLAFQTENQGQLVFTVDARPGNNPDLHGKLRQIVSAEDEDEIHWSIRAILNDHAVAALNRLRNAVAAAGLGPRRHLIVICEDRWSEGPRTREAVTDFRRLGGIECKPNEADLRTFAALKVLIEEDPDGLDDWLRARRPASGTELLSRIKPEGATGGPGTERSPDEFPPREPPTQLYGVNRPHGETVRSDSPEDGAGTIEYVTGSARPSAIVSTTPPPPVVGPHIPAVGSIPLGTSAGTGDPVSIQLEDLRRHTVIFAGSGSGKTVLIRRLVEESALRGVSSIVLDPNNDLARLGDPWPEPPTRGWSPGDMEKAADYHSNVDVAIWTPLLSGGRPLAFAPLADLRSVSDDPDEYRMAIDNAVGLLLPRSGLPASGQKLKRGQAVLTEAMRAFVSAGHQGLTDFVDYLENLPEGVGQLASSARLAAEMAETLRAETITDPLFGGQGQAADPGMLLTPPEGKRARVSVISLAGLPNDLQRQSFVSQLQMALFSWVKENPAEDKPLGGLFVMDEAQTFAPSGRSTPCTESTLALVSQARKYGLGLVFATQVPKGLHNRIPSNATTQFFGRLTAGAPLDAAREIAAAMGGNVDGIGEFGTGQFYVVSADVPFQQIRSPLCLTRHDNPLTQEAVVARARHGRSEAAGHAVT